MNYKIPKLSKLQIQKALACLAVVAGLFLGISSFFVQTQNSVSALPNCTTYSGVKSPGINCAYPSCSTILSPNPGVNCLPNCASLAAATNPVAGVNCYYLNLPLCTATSQSVSVADTGASPSPRSNCADLIDLPLCSQFARPAGSPSGTDKRSCINECSTSVLTDTSVIGHNVSCVRFCDNLPVGMTANPRTASSVGNCVPRQCQNLNFGGALPTASNCTKAACNLLVPEELDDPRMQDENQTDFAEYCDGSSVKCYSFSAAQLPYARFRENKTMCQIHKCKPATTSCGRKDSCTGFTLGDTTTDDTQNIACNTTSLIFNDGSTMSYPDAYYNYVNVRLPITDTSICAPVVCKPVIYTPYPCSGSPATARHGSCDSSGDGSICATVACTAGTACKKDLGYCYKTIDCNDSSNSNLPECISSPSNNPDDEVNLEDDTESWFYRPVPPNKAYQNNDPSQGYRVSGSCYSKSDLENQSDSRDANGCANGRHWGCETRYDLGLFTINLGYFHMQWGPDDITRSPKMCGVTRNGFRGTGYLHLCGNSQNIYAKISEKTAYYEGYVSTDFLDNADTVSKVRVCLRFKNAMRPDDVNMDDSETCGSRECAISCAFGVCKGQICGDETCRTLAVTYSESKQCVFDDSMLLQNNDSRPCTAVIDNFLRLRAVQYGHRICTFVDVKGTLAYNKMFFGGEEKLDNGITCISGSYNPDTGKCNGKDSNTDPGLSDRWRAILKVRYTGGNTTRSGVSGFYDKRGKFIKAQECVQVPLATSPPDIYNLATVQNTSKMFAPPLFMRGVSTTRNGSTAPDATANSFGTTDFLTPEVVVQFGTASKKLSLGVGYSGYEVVKDPLSYALDSGAMKTTMNGISYSANVLIKKEINASTNQPSVCLYQRVQDNSGFVDIKIACANRTFPDIDNTGNAAASIYGTRKISITSSTDSANVLNTGIYGNSSISFKYCPDAACTNASANILNFTNLDPRIPTCLGANENNFERYKVCAQRDICSKLWKECMENEISIQNFGINSVKNDVRVDCQAIAQNCNSLKGITDSSTSLIDQANSASPDPNTYGWYNELCIISGFNTKLGKVYGANTLTGVRGKCRLDSASSANPVCQDAIYNNMPPANKYFNTCKCDDASSGLAAANYTIRTQTAREAGLCVDLPTPKVCYAQNYGGDTLNTSSLDGTAYRPNGTVDLKHQDRKTSNVGSNSGDGGHGEFPTAVVGMNLINGSCNGFWRASPSGYTTVNPQMNCTLSGSVAKWSGLLTSTTSAPCLRYYCSAINTGGLNYDSSADGSYPQNGSSAFTAAGETPDSINETNAAAGDLAGITYNDVILGTRGASNGYAIWDQYNKADSSDFLETRTANRCIAGYTAMTLPTRGCNQTGNWKSVNSSCVRITCAAIAPPYSPNSASDWAAWSASKGATFGVDVYLKNAFMDGATRYFGEPKKNDYGNYITHLTPASRNSTDATPGSVRKGYCNNRLGYFQASGTPQPEITCNADGTWSAVRNPCVTSCSAVNATNGNQISEGFAEWDAMLNVPVEGSTDCPEKACKNQDGTGTGTCVAGVCVATGRCLSNPNKIRYPYSRFRDDAGNIIDDAPISGTPETAPRRTCQLTTVAGGGFATLWTTPSSVCVDKCPGFDMDTREGIGRSTYSTANYGGSVSIHWNSIAGGQTDIQTIGYIANSNPAAETTQVGADNILTQSATDYATANRTNGKFIVTRYCNADLRWSAPVIQCPTNAGIVNYSTIGVALASNANTADKMNSLKAAGSAEFPATCPNNYGYNGSQPKYACSAYSGSKLDQYYYNKTSGNACTIIQCTATDGDFPVAGSRVPIGGAASQTIDAGTSINLECARDNNVEYGHQIYPNANAGDNSCGRTVSDRRATNPTLRCIVDANGNPAWEINHACSACRNCTASTYTTSGLSKWGNCNERNKEDVCYMLNSAVRTNCGNNGDHVMNVNVNNCNHIPVNDTTTKCSVTYTYGGLNGCQSATLKSICRDGQYSDVQFQ